MTTPSSSSHFAAGLKIFLRALVRVLVILLVAALIGAGIYLGFRYVYPRYLQPVSQHTRQIEDLGARLGTQSSQSADQFTRMEERISLLESQHAADTESLGSMESRLSSAEKTLANQQALVNQLDALQGQVSKISGALDDQTALTQTRLTQVSHQVRILQMMQYFTRGRLYLIQNNLGLAREDIQSARDLLAEMQSTLPAEQQSAAVFAVQQIDLALGNLPAYPVLAAGQLDVVWELLLMDLPSAAAPASASEVQTACPEGICPITPTPTLTATPTPYGTGTPTPLPAISSTPTPMR